MKLWFKKQNEEAPASEKAEETVIPAAQLAESAPTAPSGGTPTASVSAATTAQAAPSVPIRPKQGQKALYYQMMNASAEPGVWVSVVGGIIVVVASLLILALSSKADD